VGAGSRALDVGCGKGRDAIHLAKKGWAVNDLGCIQGLPDGELI
jgi:ubiquinone/menaquinone biosynthesis C-methylase UbiE